MKKELEVNENTVPNLSGDRPNSPKVQGEALQMNENSVGGKEPTRSSERPDADKPNSHKVQGRALQVNENSEGE